MGSRIGLYIVLTGILCQCKSTPNRCYDPENTIADIFSSLTIMGHTEEADSIFSIYDKEYSLLKYHVNKLHQIEVFSSVGNGEMYYSTIDDYIRRGGDLNLLFKKTDYKFYETNQDEIWDSILEIVRKSRRKKASDDTKQVYYVDQLLRSKNAKVLLSDSQRIALDSMNIEVFMKIISSKNIESLEYSTIFRILMRHFGEKHFLSFKDDGLLEYYSSVGLCSREEYWDAYFYSTQARSIVNTSFSGIKEIRSEVGLVPIELSPDFNVKQKYVFPKNDHNEFKVEDLNSWLQNTCWTH